MSFGHLGTAAVLSLWSPISGTSEFKEGVTSQHSLGIFELVLLDPVGRSGQGLLLVSSVLRFLAVFFPDAYITDLQTLE